MVNEEIVGTDIDRNWILNAGTDGINDIEPREGDICLVKGHDNLRQAIFLRLTALIDEYRDKNGRSFERCSLYWAYDNYGSKTKQWLGKNQNVYTRSTLLQEIKNRVKFDPRIDDCEVELEDWTPNSIGIRINAHIVTGESFQEYFIFSDLPRNNENVNSPEYRNTYIDTRDQGYYGKQGELLTVYCCVMAKKGIGEDEDPRVPIGQVAISIGSYFIKEKDLQNPQEVAQSGTRDPGSCIFTFHIPQFVKLGTHKLKFHYQGIRGYNSCVGETNLYVVDRLPTSMEFIYPAKERPWYYANDWDYFTDPIVHVKDTNDYDVLHGEVRYYLSDYSSNEEIIFIEFPIIFHGSRLIQRTCYIQIKSKIFDYSTKFIFQVNAMFKNNDIFEVVGKKGEHIDWLECTFDPGESNDMDYADGTYWLRSTVLTKPYRDVDANGNRLDTDRNDMIDDLRAGYNCSITMKVIE